MLSSLLTRGVCRGWVRDGQEKSFNKTIYSIGSMTRRDFGAPFFSPHPTDFLFAVFMSQCSNTKAAREREKERERKMPEESEWEE